jgi:hypothetical protein
LTPGGTGQQISVNAAPANGFTGMVSVAIAGLPTGLAANPATLSLIPGTAQTVTVTASAGAAAGNIMVTLTGTSGALSHSATVTATIAAPPPDYTLTLSPASVTVVAGGVGTAVSVTAAAVNSFTGTVAVAIAGLPAGVTANPATLSLTPGVTQSITLTVGLNAAAATSTTTFTGTSGSLSHSATLALTVQAAPMTNAPDVATYHYNISRDGLNAKETILTQANVNSAQFGKIGSIPSTERWTLSRFILPTWLSAGN